MNKNDNDYQVCTYISINNAIYFYNKELFFKFINKIEVKNMCIFTKAKKYFLFIVLLMFIIAILAVMPGAKNKNEKAQPQKVYLPVIMYHSLLKDKNLQNNYTISPGLFEDDLKHITQNGYTTVTVNDLINFVYSDKALPDKCIMLTFDDGYYNNYYYAYPLLKEYNCKAVISPIASVTEKFTQTRDISVTYGHLSVDDIKDMLKSGCIEIQNHSYDMHSLSPRRGIEQKRAENDEVYKNIITDDINKAQSYLKTQTGAAPNCFVYPFGAKSNNTLDIIKELGFVCTMTCTEKPNVITKDPNSLFELGRYRRDSKETMAQLLNRIKAETEKNVKS